MRLAAARSAKAPRRGRHTRPGGEPPAPAARLPADPARLRHLPLHRARPPRLGRGRAARLLPALSGAALQLDREEPAPAGAGARPRPGRRRHARRSASRVALAIGRWPGVDRRLHASGAQVAFRFNSYVALALAERLDGAPGLAWMALLMALCVPLCNVAAVWPLARHGGHSYGREIARNPLIISTVARPGSATLVGPGAARAGGDDAAAHRPGRPAARPDGGRRRPAPSAA